MLLSVNVNHSSVGVAVDNRCERGVRVDLRLEVEVDKVHSGVECRGLTGTGSYGVTEISHKVGRTLSAR